ncbi:MAG: GNAT family N-acetyltransferase [Actinomycetota bacterium]
MEPSVHTTDRLILRGFRESDFEPMAEFYADEISSFYGGPCNREEAWRKFAAYPGHWALRGYGPWAIERRDTGEFIGICGPWYPEGWFAPEITWALVPGHHGHGFATEAAGTALQIAYDEFGWTTAVSVVALANEASAAVARRLGATVEARIEARYGPAEVFRHLPPGEL